MQLSHRKFLLTVKEIDMTKQLTRPELQTRIAANPAIILIEALPEKYFRDRHLPGALHLPHDQVRELAASLLPDRQAEIVTYCASAACQNSHIAAKMLTQMGYTNVSVYPGGKQDWIEAGLAVESELAAAS
jgi:rhodanese-related sulfurtransferase